MSALTLLALAGLLPRSAWKDAFSGSLRIHDILGVMKRHWRRTYAENTRETVRRQVLHQLEQAGVVRRNPDDASLPTNSPRTHYGLSEEALACLRSFGTPAYARNVARFNELRGSLAKRYRKEREAGAVRVELPGEVRLLLSPGRHNELQRAVVEQMAPRFVPGARIVYLGDTARKDAYADRNALKEVGVSFSGHDSLPDVMLWDSGKSCGFGWSRP